MPDWPREERLSIQGLVQDSGGARRETAPEGPGLQLSLPPDRPGESNSMGSRELQLAGFVLKIERCKVFLREVKDKEPFPPGPLLWPKHPERGVGGISGSSAGPGSQPLGLLSSLLPPIPPWLKQTVVLASRMPMIHLKQSQVCRPSSGGPSGAGEGKEGRAVASWQREAPRCPGSFC